MGPKKDLHSTSDHLGSYGKFQHCFKTEKAQAIGKSALTATHFKIQTLDDSKNINKYLLSIYSISECKKEKSTRKGTLIIT